MCASYGTLLMERFEPHSSSNLLNLMVRISNQGTKIKEIQEINRSAEWRKTAGPDKIGWHIKICGHLFGKIRN
jgi:hypothetical protein